MIHMRWCSVARLHVSTVRSNTLVGRWNLVQVEDNLGKWEMDFGNLGVYFGIVDLGRF